MITRQLKNYLLKMAKKFPIVILTGPRQSGKTTLVKNSFPEKTYVSLEDLDNRSFAIEDPRGFLKTYSNAILDEIQKVPDLISYIQTKSDNDNIPGQYILTGSQNFLLMENITQSLAGRAAMLKLLPLSLNELKNHNNMESYDNYIYKGFYPRLYKMRIEPNDFYPNYIQTYIERDVRLIKNISNLNMFQKFVKLCAGRTGQLLNLSSLANDCGITHSTAKSWLSILEASYIIFLLQPYYENFNKRVIKMPKLYFYDTGLACSLLGLNSYRQVESHYLKGSLFESLIISEFIKNNYNNGENSNLYFWRDKNGNEIDLLKENDNRINVFEIKSGLTITKDYFKGLNYFKKIAFKNINSLNLIYGGEINQQRDEVNIIPWNKLFFRDEG